MRLVDWESHSAPENSWFRRESGMTRFFAACPQSNGPPNRPSTRTFSVERAKGIEPSFSAWEADVLPLNYARWLARHYRAAPMVLSDRSIREAL